MSILHSKFLLIFNLPLKVQGQMAQQLNIVLCSIPSESREVIEFIILRCWFYGREHRLNMKHTFLLSKSALFRSG